MMVAPLSEVDRVKSVVIDGYRTSNAIAKEASLTIGKTRVYLRQLCASGDVVAVELRGKNRLYLPKSPPFLLQEAWKVATLPEAE